MIEIQKLKLKNFYSVGQVEQEIEFNNKITTLVFGSNVDQSDEHGSIRNGVGKAQPMYSKIRVPNGWKTMKSIGVGDIVMTPDGHTTVVTGKYPQGKKQIYEIKTRDGKKTRACKEHLWELSNGQVVSTLDIFKLLKNKKKVFLPTATIKLDNILKTNANLYTLGSFINKFEIKTDDDLNDIPYIFTFHDYVASELIDRDAVHQKGNGYVTLKSDVFNGIKEVYDHETKTLNQNIFDMEYDQKMELLKGFCDINADVYETSFKIYFNNESLAKQLRELFWSVGATAKLSRIITLSKEDSDYSGEQDIVLKVEHSDLNSFFTQTHNFQEKKVYNEVISITAIGEEDACCIKVASDESLYVTDCFIPTHNTTIINALSYALYGTAISKVKRKNTIINRFNSKEMMVRLWFKVDGNQYYIERGMKPDKMQFTQLHDDGTETVLSQGSNSNSDKEIADVLGMSHLLCKYIMLMSTYANPFMDEEAAKQRSIIEELFLINRLSEKADKIKEKESDIKKELEKENLIIKTTIENNKKIKATLQDLIEREQRWLSKKDKDIIDINVQLDTLKSVDLAQEQKNHEHNNRVIENNRLIREIKKEIGNYQWKLDLEKKNMLELTTQLDKVEHDSRCHACNQSLTSEKAAEQKETIKSKLATHMGAFDNYTAIIGELNTELSKIPVEEQVPTLYKKVEEVVQHDSNIEMLEKDLDRIENEVCPYTEQLQSMQEKGLELQEVSYDKVEEYERILNHYKFLKKLLINKDSFIRKSIIKQYLTYLNSRLKYYLDKLNLPHKVEFDSGLSFDITHMGIDTDYNLLSRGEQNRATFALNLAFRDIFEHTRQPINMLFVDELLDYGVDTSGAISGLNVLKEISDEHSRSTFLVSHKEELIEKVPNIIYVTKENGFTTYSERLN